jgi:hypothetical protein
VVAGKHGPASRELNMKPLSIEEENKILDQLADIVIDFALLKYNAEKDKTKKETPALQLVHERTDSHQI